MTNILTKQSEEKYLNYLAAQRQLYSEEKMLSQLWMAVSAAVAILGTGAIIILNSWAHYITLLSILVLVGDLVLLSASTRKRKEAASIQELVDCQVLQIPWNEALCQQPKPEMISQAADRFKRQKKEKGLQELKGWYETILKNDASHKACLAGQRENIAWSSMQIRLYLPWVIAVVFLFAVIAFIIGFATRMNLVEFFAGPLWLFLPVLVIGVKYAHDLENTLTRLGELRGFADKLWVDANNGIMPVEVVQQRCRDLQNEIFAFRAGNPGIPDWVYRCLEPGISKAVRSLR